jgi:hypothetical protein
VALENATSPSDMKLKMSGLSSSKASATTSEIKPITEDDDDIFDLK